MVPTPEFQSLHPSACDKNLHKSLALVPYFNSIEPQFVNLLDKLQENVKLKKLSRALDICKPRMIEHLCHAQSPLYVYHNHLPTSRFITITN